MTAITLTPALPNYESFLTTGRYIPSVSGLADYLVSHCKTDGYISLARANNNGSADTITFLFDNGQCWATGHFVGSERGGEWRTRALYKRRERTAVECISGLLREISAEGHLFVAVNCKTFLQPSAADDPISCLRRADSWAEKRAAFVGEAHVLRSMGGRVPSGVPATEIVVVQLDPASLLKWRGSEESKLCW